MAQVFIFIYKWIIFRYVKSFFFIEWQRSLFRCFFNYVHTWTCELLESKLSGNRLFTHLVSLTIFHSGLMNQRGILPFCNFSWPFSPLCNFHHISNDVLCLKFFCGANYTLSNKYRTCIRLKSTFGRGSDQMRKKIGSRASFCLHVCNKFHSVSVVSEKSDVFCASVNTANVTM